MYVFIFSSDHIYSLVRVFIPNQYEPLNEDREHAPDQLATGGDHTGRWIDDVTGMVFLQDAYHTCCVPFSDEPNKFSCKLSGALTVKAMQ